VKNPPLSICRAAAARQGVLVKVVIQNLVNLLDVKLQETGEKKKERTAADAVIASDKLEVPETPDSILFQVGCQY
jgi:hypothetical protein